MFGTVKGDERDARAGMRNENVFIGGVRVRGGGGGALEAVENWSARARGNDAWEGGWREAGG